MDRAIPLLALLAIFASGCRTPCPEALELHTPERTLDTFVRAFACDDVDKEYRCFSGPVKESFGGFAGYSIGREVFRRENPVQVFALRWMDVSDRVEVTLAPDGMHARARVALDDDQELLVDLVNHPAYRMVLADGRSIEGYAEAAIVEVLPPAQVATALRDPYLEVPDERPVLLEIRPRWVIESLPGIGDALGAAQAGRL